MCCRVQALRKVSRSAGSLRQSLEMSPRRRRREVESYRRSGLVGNGLCLGFFRLQPNEYSLEQLGWLRTGAFQWTLDTVFFFSNVIWEQYCGTFKR